MKRSGLIKNRDKFSMILLIIFCLTLIPKGIAKADTVTKATGERTPVLVGDLQSEFTNGKEADWNPGSKLTTFKEVGDGFYILKGKLPKGKYEYKVAFGSWDENYGQGGKPGGENIKINLDEDSDVIFYYSDKTHLIKDNTNYTPKYNEDKQPRIAGTLQTAMGEGADWSPSTSKLMLFDHGFNGVYTLDLKKVPKGSYEFKVTIGGSWDESYGDNGNNYKLNVPKDCDLSISFDSSKNIISTKLDLPEEGGFDGQVNGGKLYHNSWDSLYRTPFGAVEEGTAVTLRFMAEKDDLQYARILIRNSNPKSNKSELFNMNKVATIKLEDGSYGDVFETTFTPKDSGVYEYKFIAGDGESVKYYGDDGYEGKVGAVGDKNCPSFQLTVYDKNYKTPDWMKEAVVYQIFPDRFFNGDKANDNNKTNARGNEPIERPKVWDTLPDNPRLFEKNMNDVNGQYSGDKIWSNDFYGGDIKGVHDKLDYLQSLGVNTIYLNPVAMAGSNHKYDATDFKKLDPMFGTEKDFKEFTAELHKRGMKLIVDGVFNHVGDDSIYFDRYGKYEWVGAYEYWSYVYDTMNKDGVSEKDAKAKADGHFVKLGQKFSPEKWHLWFNIKNKKVDVGTTTERYDYQSWWGFDSLPEFKSMTKEEAIGLGLAKASDNFVNKESEYNNKEFTSYIYNDSDSVAKHWVALGADGWRLDVANEVETTVWNEFRVEMKKYNENTLILGEIWDDASKYFTGDQYDSVMNYRIRGALMDYLKNGNAERLNDSLMAIYEDYPKEAFYALMNLMSSHDVARAIYLLGGGSDTEERAEFGKYDKELGKQRLKLAALFEFGYPGAPTLYYGDEAGVVGTKDPDCRRTYPWGSEDKDLVSFYKSIGKIREENKNLFSHGDLKTLYSGKDGVYIYGRSYNGEHGIVGINPTNKEIAVTVDLSGFTGNGTEFIDKLQESYKVVVKDKKAQITIPAMSGRMMVSTNEVALPEDVKVVNGVEGSQQVSLSWNGVSGAKEYKIYSSSLNGSLEKEIKTVTDTKAIIDGLNNGEKVYFAVSAVDSNGNESKLIWSKELIPHYNIGWCGEISSIPTGNVDIANPIKVTAQVWIENVSNEAGVSKGLVGRLLVKYPGDSEFTVFNANYKGEALNNDEFTASFIGNKVGKYEYKYQFTTKGEDGFKDVASIKETEVKSFELKEGDKELPIGKINLKTPEQKSGEVNLVWTTEGANNVALYEILRDGRVIERISDKNVTSFKDVDVTNKTTYKYKVIAYSNGGTVVASNEVSVTPDLVMVDVTFKLKAPAYTPLDTKITMPGAMNGWNTNAWEMSRNGAVTTDWTYTISVLEGEVIEYKYVKGGEWNQEALMNYSNPKAAKQSKYGCTTGEGGNEKVTVVNQGDGKMVIQNEVIRWKDMPIVISDPSNGSTTKNESIVIKGNAMLDPNLTINGEKVAVDENGSFVHEVKLDLGKNSIKIHIEPTEENKKNPDIFNNNSEAIGFATKDVVLDITRLDKDEVTPPEVKPEPPTDPDGNGDNNGDDLPQTGGKSGAGLVVFGLILIALGGVIVYKRKLKEE